MGTFFETQCRLKGYFPRHCDMTQFTLTHHMVNKPFLLPGLAAEYRSRRRRRWCDQHCGRPSHVYDSDRRTKLIALETISCWFLLKKTKKSLFEPPFRALRGNVRTPSMVRWKARGQLYIRHNWTFFAISYGWDVMSGNLSKLPFFEGGRSLSANIWRGMGHRPPTNVGVRKLDWLLYHVVPKYMQSIISFSHNTDRQGDRQTDRQTELRQQCHALLYMQSHGKN